MVYLKHVSDKSSICTRLMWVNVCVCLCMCFAQWFQASNGFFAFVALFACAVDNREIGNGRSTALKWREEEEKKNHSHLIYCNYFTFSVWFETIVSVYWPTFYVTQIDYRARDQNLNLFFFFAFIVNNHMISNKK